jgi:hypothetical protein
MRMAHRNSKRHAAGRLAASQRPHDTGALPFAPLVAELSHTGEANANAFNAPAQFVFAWLAVPTSAADFV